MKNKPFWVKHEWDKENPRCVCCDISMGLSENAEWDENPALNLCHDCVINIIDETFFKKDLTFS